MSLNYQESGAAILSTPITSAKTETITESETKGDESLRSELGDLRTRITQIENAESTRRKKTETCIENAVDIRQLLAETAELRECIGILRSKISHLETFESSTLLKIADIESLLNNTATSNVCDSQEPTTTDEETEEKTLPHDTFSFMIISQPFSTPLLLSLTVVFFQITAFSLVGASIMKLGDSDNPFVIPANVTIAVRFTQILAVVIAIITQDDIRTGLNLFLEGYGKEHIRRSFPNVTFRKWILSILARLIEGSLSLLVTFLLIMTVETVVDLLLNFTAMQFVSQLDEVCFFMSREGFFGRKNAIAARMVSNNKIRRKVTKRRGHIHRAIFLVVLFAALFAGWLTVGLRQNAGKYLCSTVYVQFSDEFDPILGTFSGLYDQRTTGNVIFSSRNFEYVERKSGNGVLSYCQDLEAWTFTTIDPEGKINSCDWLARSEETTTFDLTETASMTWFVRDSLSREAILDPFFLSCYDCDEDVTSDGFHTRCSGHGHCNDAVCSCNDGWYGLRCEFHEPCQTLEFDSRFGPFQGSRRWSSVFNRFELNHEFVDAHHRPVYVSEYNPGKFDIFLFTGRRWVATYSALLPITPEDGQSAIEALAAYFRGNISFAMETISVAFVSEPVDVGTARDGASPIALIWFAFQTFAMDSENLSQMGTVLSPVPSMLLCAVCDSMANQCLYDGECVNGTCQCSIGSSGARCQIPPLQNGRCDLFYNTPEFEYDGGDCCESTCVSSTQFSCGRDESGFVDLGYFFCRLPSEGWRLIGESIVGEAGSASGYVVKLSGGGEILAVSEPMFDRVRLFDKVGSQWIQRGLPMEGHPGSYFGASVAMSSGPFNMVNNPFLMVPVTIAVGNSFSPTLCISIFDCSGGSCSQVGNDLIAIEDQEGILLGVIDISSDGGLVVAGGRPILRPETAKFPYPLAVFRLDTLGGEWTRQKLDIAFRNSEGIYSVALSGGGDILALASFETGFSPGGDLWIANNTRRVYALDGSVWVALGTSIVEATPHRSLLYDVQGQSMDLSFDGKVLALGLWTSESKRGTYTRVFAWANSESDWIQRGSPVSCGDMELQGWSVSLSSDGSIVAIGSADYNRIEGFVPPTGGDGATCTFSWNGLEWASIGRPLDGSSGSSVDLSAEGTDLAVGLQGHSLVYEFPRDHCPHGTSLLRISLTTDGSPQATTWNVLANETSEILLQGGPYSAEEHIFASFVEEMCVLSDHCFVFTIYDNLDLNSLPESSGMSPPGGYALFLNGERLPGGGNVTSVVERVHIGNCLTCPVGMQLFRMLIQTCAPIAWTLVSNNAETMFYNESFGIYFNRYNNDCSFANQTTYWEEVCLSLDECSLFSILAPPVTMQDLAGGSNGEYIFPSKPTVQYRLFIDEDEIASNATWVHSSREQQKSVAFVPIGNCAR